MQKFQSVTVLYSMKRLYHWILIRETKARITLLGVHLKYRSLLIQDFSIYIKENKFYLNGNYWKINFSVRRIINCLFNKISIDEYNLEKFLLPKQIVDRINFWEISPRKRKWIIFQKLITQYTLNLHYNAKYEHWV